MSTFFRCNKVSGKYISSDDINKLRFKVKLKEINAVIALPKFETFTSSAEGSEQEATGHYEELTLSWQERSLKTSEINLYSDIDNCKTEVEKTYNQLILENNLTSQNTDKKIFTFIEEDNFQNNSSLISSIDRSTDRVSRELRRLSLASESSQDPPTPRASPLHMAILADMNDYERDPSSLLSREHLLFSLEWDPNKHLLTVSPDFNDLKINPYILEINYDSKRVFEYSIEQINAEPIDDKKKAEIEILKKVIESRKTGATRLIYGNFHMPPKGVFKYLYIIEILSACSFEYDNLAVKFSVEVPCSYSCAGPTEGVTCAATGDPEGVVHFGHTFEVLLLYRPESVGQELVQQATLLLAVSAYDGWGRERVQGSGSLPLPPRAGRHEARVRTSRPASCRRERFFAGSPSPAALPAPPAPAPGRKLSALGEASESSGSVNVRVSVVLQGARPAQERAAHDVPGVPDVLRAYGRARRRLAAVRGEGAAAE